MTTIADADDIGGTAVADLLARYERERRDHLRQIDLLQLEVQRYRQQAEDAQARAAMVQAAMDRHMAKCDRDEVAVQRLRAELQEANARRKEQVAIIERREARIESLLGAGGRGLGAEATASSIAGGIKHLLRFRFGKRRS